MIKAAAVDILILHPEHARVLPFTVWRILDLADDGIEALCLEVISELSLVEAANRRRLLHHLAIRVGKGHGRTGSDTGGRGRLGPIMSSINDVAKIYDEFEEAFVDVMTAKSEGLSFSRRMKLRLARSRLRAHKDFTQREYEAAVLRADARAWKILG